MRILTVLTVLLTAWPVHAQLDRETAVVALTDSAGDGPALANAVRQALVALHARVLPLEDTQARMFGPRNSGRPVALAALEEDVARAERALSDDKTAEAINILEQALVRAEGDPDLTAEKSEALRQARVRLAAAHLLAAGRMETGQANTESGKKALDQFRRVLAQDPAFTLDPARYPPRLRGLLDKARAEVASLPKGRLAVQSRPVGATVMVDGRPLGLTPLTVDTLPAGTHRVWLEWQGKRSLRRTVQVGPPTPVQLNVDMLVEGAWLPSLGGLRADPVDLEDGLLQETAALLGVRLLVVVLQRGDMAGVLVFDADKDLVVRRGSTAVSTPELATVLARFSVLGLVGREVEPLKPLADPVTVPRRVAVLGATPLLLETLNNALQSRGSDALVDAGGLEERCGAANTCLLDGARALKLDALIQVSQSPGRWDAGFLDVANGREVRRASLRAAHLTTAQAQALAVKLLDPLWFAGGVEVVAPRDGLRVLLDGAELGTTPVTAGRTGIMVGRHVLRVSGTALDDAETTLEVPYGPPVEVVVGLNGRALALTVKGQRSTPAKAAGGGAAAPVGASRPAPRAGAVLAATPAEPKAGRPLWPWGLTGAGGAAAAALLVAVVGGGALAALGGAWAATFERTQSGGLVVRDGETVQQAQLRGYATLGMLGAGSGIAAVALVGAVLAAATAVTGVVLWLVL